MIRKKTIFGATAFTVILLSALAGMLVLPQLGVEIGLMSGREWGMISLADPGAGEGGLMEIYVKDHVASGSWASTYNANVTIDATVWAHGDGGADTVYTTIGTDVHYNDEFDIIFTYRFNASQAKAGNGTWMMSWVYLNFTSADLSVSSAITIQEYQIATNDSYMWVNFVIADADAGTGLGFTISRGSTVDDCDWETYAYM